MHRSLVRSTLGAMLALGLVACASAPKKSVSQPAGIPDKGGVQHSKLPDGKGKKKSPYAPAQEDPRTRGNYTAGGLYKPGVSDSTPDHVPDVDAIPEPEVTSEPRSQVGNRATYSVLGKQYKVLDNTKGYVEKGTASYYGQKFHGRRTSNMEVYDMYAFTAAHKTLPLPSFARVTNLDNGKSVVVRVNDRGPFHEGRVIDLSYAAAVKLGITARGTGRVEVRALQPGDDDRPVLASTPASTPAPAPSRPAADAKPTPIDRLIAAMPVASASAGELPPGVRIATGKPTTLAGAFAAARGEAAPALVAPAPAVDGDGVVLQVASFTARANADRALTTLRQAGIDTAQISDASANGQTIWRLRVGPLQAAQAPELAARIAGLGFGQPQRVRD